MRNRQIYTGYTHDLKRRINEHKNSLVITTSKYLPVRLIFYECYLNKEDAQRREGYLKTEKGKSSLRMMLTKTLNNL